MTYHNLRIGLIVFFSFLSFFSGISQGKINFQELDARSHNIKSIVYKRTKNQDLNAYYFLPEGAKPGMKFPAIFFIHGGAWTGGNPATFFPYAAYFATQGMVGMCIDYRLIKTKEDDILHCIHDSKSAIRFIKKNASLLNIDTSKIILCGESAGGHLAASIELFSQFNDAEDDLSVSVKPSALILLNPVLNLATNTFIRYVDANLTTTKAAIPPADSSVYLQKAKTLSPLYHVRDKMPKTLLINGSQDKITPPEYAMAFVDSANRHSKTCTLELLPDQGHAFAVPHYKSNEITVVNTIIKMHYFMKELGYLKREPSLVNANDPNWLIRK
jgi:acetyl esterase/lipase